MTNDLTEGPRRVMQALNNADQRAREELEADHGQCWDTEELSNDFDVVGFLAPFVRVRRKSDGQMGLLEFRHSPRLYYSFTPE